jgi:hypothetical protein
LHRELESRRHVDIDDVNLCKVFYIALLIDTYDHLWQGKADWWKDSSSLPTKRVKACSRRRTAVTIALTRAYLDDTVSARKKDSSRSTSMRKHGSKHIRSPHRRSHVDSQPQPQVHGA